MAGVLSGIRIIEFGGIGPGPFCGMMLADHGADVIRIDRIGRTFSLPDGALSRGRRSIAMDLKQPEALNVVRRLCAKADGLFEGFRPGVMERLGLGPDELLQLNDKLVYGRMTGWGQQGPFAQRAGHDINYIAIAGALHGIGRAGERPIPPVNYVADFGGGGMLLAFGMVAALLAVERNNTKGQVVDAAMTDGTALLMGMNWGLFAEKMWRDERGSNLIDGGAHFYDTYETLDGRYLAVGAIEPQFYAELLVKLGLTDALIIEDRLNPDNWVIGREKLAGAFKSRPLSHWVELFKDSDACVSPVLSMIEAAAHPQNSERGTYCRIGGAIQPMPAPRLSATPAPFPAPPLPTGAHTDEILSEAGLSTDQIFAMKERGAVA